MELIAEQDQHFPTSTPVLDVLRPLSSQRRDTLSTGNCVFISSAVILAFTGLPAIRFLLDSVSTHPLIFWAACLVVPLLSFFGSLVVHEAGHLLAGKLTGFERVLVKLGPLQFKSRNFHQGLGSEQVFVMGHSVMKPKGGEQLPQRLFYLVLGGPLANVFLPVFLEIILYLVPPRSSAAYLLGAFTIHVFSALSVLAGISSLLPDTDSNGEFSDGARLLMLARDDVQAARWLAILQLQVALNSGIHPRHWDESLVARAAADKDETADAAIANWLAYQWAIGRQEVILATRDLEQTLALIRVVPGHLRDRIFLEAAVFQAWYRHNLSKGRFWNSQLRRQKSLPEIQRLRMEIALQWAEGRLFDAWEQLGPYLAKLRELPESPVRELIEKNALEWKAQMESRMLAGAWATMHSWAQKMESESAVMVGSRN